MPSRKTRAASDNDIDLLKTMLLIRRFEERAAQMYGLRKIGGFCHLYIGQEAVATGAIAAIDLTKDYVVTAYRDHGHALACGLSPDSVMAELYGKATGCSRGKGGSMHMYSAEKHMLGGNGIVGSQIPVATGVALSAKQRGDGVVLCFFGDGAIHQGAFHESLNLARIWDLPIVYLCENNQYGMGTDYRRVSAVDDFSLMGASYRMEGKQVDGMDIHAVHEAVSAAVKKARTGEPSLLEVKTYRYRGHSMSDPAKYRTKEEVKSHMDLDPILLLKKRLFERKELDDDTFRAMDEEAKKVCEKAVQFAEESPEPELSALYEDVLA
ncbi:MAG: pyruvate dehydrogenase (acetyl-transferring) E1 component subunit alpha [Chitinivibrionales bacterium]|nr:pyruvate dehydrogenase (acetyl-transferring) E1 component subunit alpha [Chitinivibrionales bacterium]